MAIAGLMLVLGIVNFVSSIWAAVSLVSGQQMGGHGRGQWQGQGRHEGAGHGRVEYTIFKNRPNRKI